MSIQNILASAMAVSVENADVLTVDQLDAAMEAFEDATSAADSEVAMVESEAAIEITERTIASLEEISSAVAVSQENGGLDAQSAALLSVSVSAIMAPFGGSSEGSVPSLESFEEDGGRVTATAVAAEGIGAQLKKLWDGLVSMLSRAYEAVTKWLNENFSKMGRLEKAAEALSVKAKEAKGEPEKKQLDVSGAQYLYEGDKAIGLTPAGIKAVTDFVKTPSKVLPISYNDADDYTKFIAEAKLEDGAAIQKFLNELNEGLKTYNEMALEGSAPFKGDKRIKAPKSGDLFKLDVPGFPGDTCVTIHKIADTQPVVVSFVGPTKKEGDTKHDALTGAEAAALCDVIKSAAATMAASKKDVDNLAKATKVQNKAGATLVKSLGDSTSNADEIKKSLNALVTMNNNARKPLIDSIRVSSQILSASYGFAKASVKNIKAA